MGRAEEVVRQPESIAAAYAARLLSDLGCDAVARTQAEHPAQAWARSGLMALTGLADGDPLMCAAPLASCAEGALAALAALAPAGALEGISAAQLLGERAAIAGLKRQGRVAPGGGCHLLRAADGDFALQLSRPEDWALLPAWLETDVAANWAALERALGGRTLESLLARGRELGLALAPCAPVDGDTPPWLRGVNATGAGRAPAKPAPLVIDLSSLWAGPLCTHLLQRCGARVIKVESARRMDGARRYRAEFFDLLHAGKESLALDLTRAEDAANLSRLIGQADIVIEASRPRALRQLGISAEHLLRENPALTWISLTGYGLGEPQENWIAYGDDAGVAAGLSALMAESAGVTMFCGDAIADPLTGLHAALAAWTGWRAGGAGRVTLALCDVVRHAMLFDLPGGAPARRDRLRDWSAVAPKSASPGARTCSGCGPALGEHTAALRKEFGLTA